MLRRTLEFPLNEDRIPYWGKQCGDPYQASVPTCCASVRERVDYQNLICNAFPGLDGRPCRLITSTVGYTPLNAVLHTSVGQRRGFLRVLRTVPTRNVTCARYH